MKFSYRKIRVPKQSAFPKQKYFFRPIIPIRITHNKKSIVYDVLIDSGADYCIFHADIADYLGIPTPQGKKIYFSGIASSNTLGYVHDVDLAIGGNDFRSISVVFSYDIASHAHGILGHYGVFNLFRIIFDIKKEQIELREKQK